MIKVAAKSLAIPFSRSSQVRDLAVYGDFDRFGS
jgi:hypothetical protein